MLFSSAIIAAALAMSTVGASDAHSSKHQHRQRVLSRSRARLLETQTGSPNGSLSKRATWTNQGCVTDGSARALTGYSEEKGGHGWTADDCIALCQSKGFSIAGLEVMTECYCGNSFSNGLGQAVDSSQCNWYVWGTPSVAAGGPWKLSIYSATNPISGGAATTTGTVAAAAATTSVAAAVVNAATSVTTTVANTVTAPASSGSKAVYVHFMVGNVYSYTYDMWLADIKSAAASGFTGFALNIGSDSWQPAQVANAYAAAQASGTGFKLFISFDMTVIPCSSSSDGALLQSYVKTYASHPNQAWYQGKVLVSTFAGSDCSFGAGNWNDGFNNALKTPMSSAGISIYFMPSIFLDPTVYSSQWIMDGELGWNSGWPSAGGDIDFSNDAWWLQNLGSKGYMAAVSPVFYTHYGVNSYNKNWLYKSDGWLFAARWEILIANRDKFDLIEALTWNDFGESSYIGPIEGDQPNSQAWVNGFDHTAILAVNQYYSTAFTTGSYPAITQDKIFLMARPHPVYATATSDSVGPPTNRDYSSDNFYALIFASSAATVTLSSNAGSQTFSVNAGATRLQYALATGGGMRATLTRNGQTVVDYNPSGYTFVANPATYNFNYWIGASS